MSYTKETIFEGALQAFKADPSKLNGLVLEASLKAFIEDAQGVQVYAKPVRGEFVPDARFNRPLPVFVNSTI
jgi:hypothetical protein